MEKGIVLLDIIKHKQHYLQLYNANITGERKQITK